MSATYSRHFPFQAPILERIKITGSGSTKETYAITLAVEEGKLPYKVGDSLGILPMNAFETVAQILKQVSARREDTVFDKRAEEFCSAEEFFLRRANLAKASRPLLEKLFERGAKLLKPLLIEEGKTALQNYLQTHSVLEILAEHQNCKILASDLAETCLPLLPRFYSIANSAKFYPGQIDLLVAYVKYQEKGRLRFGVGSHFLCDLAEAGKTPIPIYVQPSNHFTLPEDSNAPIILIGPGTGVAPFRAFLQERLATQSRGKNWLFFGERNKAFDFYYAPFFLDLEKKGFLRLSLAFSRDQHEKIYVQHRMWEERKSLWNWLEQGAFLYVCGDAEKMAKEVDLILHQIVQEQGNFSEEEARTFVKNLKKTKKYLTDVY